MSIPYKIPDIVALAKFTVTMILLRFRAGTYPIVHVFHLALSQHCCKIKLVSLWVHLNVRPNCVVFDNLSWNSLLQYTNTNHKSDKIVVLSNTPKPDVVGPVK